MSKKKIILINSALAGATALSTLTVFAQPAADGSETNVILHKRQFIDPAQEPTPVQNTGAEMLDFAGEAYNTQKYGEVEFTVYSITKAKVALAGDLSDVQAAADALDTEIEQAGDGALPEGITKLNTHKIEDNGDVSFALQNNHDVFYLIRETKSPATVVGKAKPMLVHLPVTDANKTGHLTDVHLYPKNVIQSINLDLLKLQLPLGESTLAATALQGATFSLYKGEPGSGQLLQADLITNDEGKISISDIAVGKYYLVETATTQGLMLSRYAEDTAENKLTFEVSETGELTHDLGFDGFINFTEPTITKEADTTPEIGEGVHEEIDYVVTVPIPQNFEEYTTFMVTDTPSENLEVIKDSVVVTANDVITPDVQLTGMITPTVNYIDEGRDGYTVTFELSPEGLQAVKEGRLKSFKIAYKGRLLIPVNPTTPIVGEHPNTVKLTYQASPQIKGEKEDEAVVKSYGAKFKKVDGGRFGLLGDTGLEGAEFIVQMRKTDKSEVKYLKRDNDEGRMSLTSIKEDALVYTSSADGTFEVIGLADLPDDGEWEYVLEEIKAPEGFVLPMGEKAETVFKVGDDEYQNALNLMNMRSPELPMTGSEKLLLAGGAGVLLLGTFALITIKRKRQDA